MTEAEWLACEDPETLLKKARFATYRRKSRLFAVACCRCVWTHFVDDRSRHAVEISERHADGLATDHELQIASRQAHEAHRTMLAVLGKVGSGLEWAAAYAADAHPILAAKRVIWMVREPRCRQEPWTNLSEAPHLTPCAVEERTGLMAAIRDKWKITALPEFVPTGADRPTQCRLIRDIFGNPFRRVKFSPEWCVDTALTLARQMYDSRDFSAMPILADALQDAGCDNEDILNHCRSESVHVRGCWVVDLLLGKSCGATHH